MTPTTAPNATTNDTSETYTKISKEEDYNEKRNSENSRNILS